jgi:hypothetical protein
MYRMMCDFQASSRVCLSFAGRLAHHAAAWWAWSTASVTSSSPKTPKVAMTSDVAGFTVSKVSRGRAGPCVHSVVAIAVHHRSVQP